MKSLKFKAPLAEAVLSGEKTSTIRLNDEKNITVDDVIEFINSDTKLAFGTAVVESVLIKRLGDLTEEDLRGHETYSSTEEMYKVFKGYYGADAGPHSHAKIIHFKLNKYEEPQKPAHLAQTYDKLKLFADGGSRGNPGPSSAGFVLFDMDGNVVKKDGVYLGITTNNQAEYHALKTGLEGAKLLGASEVEVYMDSLLVVNQMKGLFKVKNRDLWPIYESIKEYASQFKRITFNHVPRELNKEADAMVNQILDETAKSNNKP